MTFDWFAAQDDIQAIIADHAISVALRRGDVTLAEQTMRIEIAGSGGSKLQSDAARQSQQAVVILGAHDLDIALGDRLTYGDVLYQVTFVQPNRLACTIAEAVVVE